MKYYRCIDIPKGYKAKVELIDEIGVDPFLHITLEPIEEPKRVNLIEPQKGLLSKIKSYGKKGQSS